MKRAFLVLSVLWSILATPITSQTTDCHHESNRVAYWDNLRLSIGNITDIKGNELTLASKDSTELKVRVFHLTSATNYYKQTEQIFHRMDVAFIRDNYGGLWAVSYCYYCREVFACSKLEGL